MAPQIDTSVRPAADTRPNWNAEQVTALFAEPFGDLVYRAQQVHRAHFDPN
ncbi:MAG: biotin synthase, partial [Gammaproteobacteria bacterium]|nr:biotin synthase [Gammaproteobacteria bacterium]